ncbi:Iron-sulfur cluster assembly enzyme ISCU, mitochondrial [Nosema bombycis CQ1]|uniref:Iron-sulfur cluster assembly enzyme ISCU, mitochondrial n=1 Tax=Nosema bombycis (strain CQ1 / CVCC 102059) TaxID=578461 RepID=R0M905_NOSB1|nr:Iron-sulfur cluster assembly enzyme ISCU, mitochondrial [Nosema bombycis CQ1]|eukprot:EOB14424.1 Iron-sulfur cluster assembly enzyme ISCU, mitochondrial [Nosema bombycis CQ1]
MSFVEKLNSITSKYHENVLDHFKNPRNIGSLNKNDVEVGTGIVGAPACGDVMKLQIKVNKDNVIEDAKFKTFGCGSAIASSSLATEWIKGKTIEDSLKITNERNSQEIVLASNKIALFDVGGGCDQISDWGFL